jgi:hypothetical protein
MSAGFWHYGPMKKTGYLRMTYEVTLLLVCLFCWALAHTLKDMERAKIAATHQR